MTPRKKGDTHEQKTLVEPRPEPGQEGILGLLEGQRMFIEPEGFAGVHARGGAEHRLRSGDVSGKWRPLGIGAMEGEQISDGDKKPPVLESGEEAEGTSE